MATDETPDEKPPISEALRDAIGQVLNAYQTNWGLTVLNDFILIAEVIPGDPEVSQLLRIIDSDLSAWKRRGFLTYTRDLDLAEDAGSYAWSASLDRSDDDD